MIKGCPGIGRGPSAHPLLLHTSLEAMPAMPALPAQTAKLLLGAALSVLS